VEAHSMVLASCREAETVGHDCQLSQRVDAQVRGHDCIATVLGTLRPHRSLTAL
jgi:hypothetical protein